MTCYVDNQPNYLTSQAPEFRAARYEVIARGPERNTDLDDYCDPTEQTMFIRVKATDGPCDKREIESLISKAVSPTPCGCEHDCCGHRHGWARVTMLNLNTAEVLLKTSRNY